MAKLFIHLEDPALIALTNSDKLIVAGNEVNI